MSHGYLLLMAALTFASMVTAHAETEQTLIANQYAKDCPHNHGILIANALTGEFIEDLGRPHPSLGNTNEVKPYDLNRRIVALWGGSKEFGQKGGIGIYNRETRKWEWHWFIPDTWELGAKSAHSVCALPDGHFAIAQTGSIDGQGDGFVVIVNPEGNVVQQVPLSSAHGVEWDGQRQAGFAAGSGAVKRYDYDPGAHRLTETVTYAFPLGAEGGHDLRRRRTDNDYLVTTNKRAYVLRPEAAEKFEDLKLGGGIKCMDQRFDGLIEWNYMWDGLFRFIGEPNVAYKFCNHPYKGGRWLWPVGRKVYPEDTVAEDTVAPAAVGPGNLTPTNPTRELAVGTAGRLPEIFTVFTDLPVS